MGNSEVGHTNLGAGRIVYQDLVRINRAVEDGSFFKNDALLLACRRAKESGGALHLWGSSPTAACTATSSTSTRCLELARREGVPRVFVHAFMDGRDTPPKSGLDYMAELEKRLRETGGAGRDRVRALLRDGPRQALGPRGARLRRDGARRGPSAPMRVAAIEAAYAAARPTSS